MGGPVVGTQQRRGGVPQDGIRPDSDGVRDIQSRADASTRYEPTGGKRDAVSCGWPECAAGLCAGQGARLDAADGCIIRIGNSGGLHDGASTEKR